MESLTYQDVLEILRLVQESDVEYLEVEVGGTRVVADRSGTSSRRVGGGNLRPAETPKGSEVSVPTPVEPSVPSHQLVESPEVKQAAATATAASETTLTIVTAPVVGVFYRAPEPGEEPFCSPGKTVTVGDTLGLVEVMKMFNSVTADVSGEIIEIFAENDEFVEFGQPLFSIRPAS